MDYTKQGFWFKIKKVLRYFRLYGFQRTLVKVQGQYHMQRRYSSLPVYKRESFGHSLSQVGIIGCGNYAFSNIAYYLSKNKQFQLRGVMDADIHKAASLFSHYGAKFYTDDAEMMINDSKIDLVFIASNHCSHAEYAIKCLSAGKNVHVEKPHVVNSQQLTRLIDAMRQKTAGKVFLGFNRPRSQLFQLLQSKLKEQEGPLMINWFIAGHEIPEDHWYFDEKEGGRVLGNLCHWTDLTLHLVGLSNAFPCTVCSASPSGSKSDFVFSVVFADRSCAAITFSAKGHAFEGVREVLNVHKGSLMGNITDFQSLSLEIIDCKTKTTIRHRDHGHEANIVNSLGSARGETIDYVFLTAKLFLAFKEALDTNEKVIVSGS
jgi:predicted dehydrogenase